MTVVDASNQRTRETVEPQMIAALKQNEHIPSILVLNKVICPYVCVLCTCIVCSVCVCVVCMCEVCVVCVCLCVRVYVRSVCVRVYV